jgi:hypothetical protein
MKLLGASGEDIVFAGALKSFVNRVSLLLVVPNQYRTKVISEMDI